MHASKMYVFLVSETLLKKCGVNLLIKSIESLEVHYFTQILESNFREFLSSGVSPREMFPTLESLPCQVQQNCFELDTNTIPEKHVFSLQ